MCVASEFKNKKVRQKNHDEGAGARAGVAPLSRHARGKARNTRGLGRWWTNSHAFLHSHTIHYFNVSRKVSDKR